MRKNNLSINSNNILPIIKKWLYSNRDIFLRELISNACDAIKKLRTLREYKEAPHDEAPFEVHLRIDNENKTLTISDNGIGMTEEEVEKYIAQIAFSGAEEFLAKYKSQSEKDPIIGHFGLGFYSAYMVAKVVEIETLSYAPDAKPVRWICDGSTSYEIGAGSRTTRGTDIILHLDENALEFLESSKIDALLHQYCLFAAEPLFINGTAFNNSPPLWMKNPSECTDEEYQNFFRRLYPADNQPVFWIHLNVEYPFRLQGILYFPKQLQRFSRQEESIKLYCNRVFVSDNCRDILPDYLSILRGAIDSPDIPLNVSRSYLQVDHNVRQLSAHISKKIADKLTSLFKTDRAKYIELWPEVEPLVKLGMLHDDKFYDRSKDALIWKNNKDEWTTVQEYLDRSNNKTVYYCNEECPAAVKKAFIGRNLELLHISSAINTAVVNLLEKKLDSVTFQRIDSTLDSVILDESREKTLLDENGKSLATRIAEFFQASLPQEKLDVQAKSLASDNLPAMVVYREENRRLRDILQLTQGKADRSVLGKPTFVVNTNNKLVLAAYRLADKQPEVAREIVHQIYDLTRFVQKDLEASEIEQVATRQHSLIEKMSELIS